MNIRKIFVYASVACIFTGIIAGAVCMSVSSCERELYDYIVRCFDTSGANARFEIFKNALAGNFKIFLIITACAFFKAGAAATLLCCVFKGFLSGFTAAAFVKYCGGKGLLMPLSYSLSTVVLLPVIVAFSSVSATFAVKKLSRDKSDVGRFLLFSLLCLCMFFLSSLADGYVTPVLIKLVRPFAI